MFLAAEPELRAFRPFHYPPVIAHRQSRGDLRSTSCAPRLASRQWTLWRTLPRADGCDVPVGSALNKERGGSYTSLTLINRVLLSHRHSRCALSLPWGAHRRATEKNAIGASSFALRTQVHQGSRTAPRPRGSEDRACCAAFRSPLWSACPIWLTVCANGPLGLANRP